MDTFTEGKDAYLMTRCNSEARALRAVTELENDVILLPQLETGIVLVHEIRNFRSKNAIIYGYDSNVSELEYIQHKFPGHYNLIDVNARHYFPKTLDITRLKYVTGFNYHGARDRIINLNVDNRCDACGAVENWLHVLQCPCEGHISMTFVDTLTTKLLDRFDMPVEVKYFMSNVKNFLLGKTNLIGPQQFISYDSLFRGFIVRDWYTVTDTDGKFGKPNKIIVQECVKHYGRMWEKRNLRRHSEPVRRERLLQ